MRTEEQQALQDRRRNLLLALLSGAYSQEKEQLFKKVTTEHELTLETQIHHIGFCCLGVARNELEPNADWYLNPDADREIQGDYWKVENEYGIDSDRLRIYLMAMNDGSQTHYREERLWQGDRLINVVGDKISIGKSTIPAQQHRRIETRRSFAFIARYLGIVWGITIEDEEVKEWRQKRDRLGTLPSMASMV